MKFDPTKPVQTRDGRKARIVCADVKNNYKILALITAFNGVEHPVIYTEAGSVMCSEQPNDTDLINVPQEITKDLWINIYDYASPTIHESREKADLMADKSRIACKHIVLKFKEGDGL